MITRTAPSWQAEEWQKILASSISNLDELLARLNLTLEDLPGAREAARQFKLRVPVTYLSKINPGDPNDPLLMQVLPLGRELQAVPGYGPDPLGEAEANPVPGVLHKYQGRVLLVAAGACGINCRYCFRRHFPYDDNQLSRQQLLEVIAYLKRDPSISEVILSGGDPLLVPNERLSQIVAALETVGSVRRLRIHTRLPVAVPQRIDTGLLALLAASPLDKVMVVHSNHPRELDERFAEAMASLRARQVTLLNQSVLLAGVNDQASVLAQLSERLFSAGVLPYYLHLLDPVAGADQFEVSVAQARTIMHELQSQLPGYLVPKLVKELPGAPSKTLVDLGAY